MEVEPFTVRIEEEDLQDLRERLRRTRWLAAETVPDRSQGPPVGGAAVLHHPLGGPGIPPAGGGAGT